MRRPSLFFDIAAEDKSGRAFSSMHQQVNASERSLNKMRSRFLAVAGAATTFGAAIMAAARGGALQIDEAAKSARRMDASIGAFRGLQLAASEAGVPLSVVANEIQNLNREIANIGTSGNADRALSRLGLSAGDLAGLDADDKLAAIADRVKDLGLSSGQASALLRDLGIRNREMALLLVGGGEAIRRASQDIADYGLAISQVDAARIEAANDQIARLGLVTQYAGQRLAVELVPAMGAFAQAITDSLREGGLLRGVLDGLVDNLDRIGTYAGVAVTLFGTRYVAALVAARVATFTLSGALTFLRGALIRTGIGALVVGAGELVYQLSRLVKSTGGWGAALSLLGEVAAGVWEGIKTSASSIVPALSSVWQDLKSSFLSLVADLSYEWNRFLTNVIVGLPPSTPLAVLERLTGAARSASDTFIDFQNASERAAQSAQTLREQAAGLVTQGFDDARAAAGRLATAVADVEGETSGAADAADRLNAAFSSLDEPAAAGGKPSTIPELGDQLEQVGSKMEQVKSQMAGAFANIVTGAQSARDAIGGLLQSFANQAAQAAFSTMFSMIPGFANGTHYAPGGLAIVGERGPELVNLPRGSRVHTAERTRAMLGGGKSAGGTVRLVIEEGPAFASRVRTEAEGVAVEVTRAGLGAYDRTLPDRVQAIARDPRRR